MHIRIAQTGDAAAIAPIYEGFFRDLAENEPRYYRPFNNIEAYAKKTLRDENADIILAEHDCGIAGFVHVHMLSTPQLACFIPKKYAMVADLFVRPAFRKNGVASALLEGAYKWARSRSLDYVELRVLRDNEKAITLYEKEGFEKVIHVMRKEL